MSGLFTYMDYLMEYSINNDGDLVIYLFNKNSDKFYCGSVTPNAMREKIPTYTITTLLSIIEACCIKKLDGCVMNISIENDVAILMFIIAERFVTHRFSFTLHQKEKTASDKVNIALSDFMKRMNEFDRQSALMQQTISKLKEEFTISHQKQVDELHRIIESFKAEMLTRSFLLNPSEIILPDTIARIPTNITKLILIGINSTKNMNMIATEVIAKRNPEYVSNKGKLPNDPSWNHNYILDAQGRPYIQNGKHVIKSKYIAEAIALSLGQDHQYGKELFPFRFDYYDPNKPENAQNEYPKIPFNHGDINQLMLLQDLEYLEINGNLNIINWSPIYNLANLKTLKLINCNLTDETITNIIRCSKWADTIEIIHIDENMGISDLRIFQELRMLKEISYKKTMIRNDICLDNVPLEMMIS